MTDSEDELLRRCIYCDDVLSRGTAPAHVMPNSLGGRKTSVRTVCTTCNTATSVDEKELTDGLRDATAFLGVTRGDGKPCAPTFKDIPEIGRVAIWGGIPTVVGKSFRQQRTESKTEFGVSVPHDLDAAALQVAHLLRRTRKSPDDLKTGNAKLNVGSESRFLDAVPFRLELGTPGQMRAVAKMALELLAFHRPGLACARELQALRRYVRYKEGLVDVQLDPWTPGSGLIDPSSLTEFANVIEVWSCGAHLVASVSLLGFARFTLPLSDHWSSGSIRIAYAIDPVESKKLCDVVACEDGSLPAGWPARRRMTAEYGEELFSAFAQKAVRRGDKLADEQVLKDVRAKWTEAMAAEQVLSEEDVAMLSTIAAEEFTRVLLRKDARRSISLDELFPLIVQHFTSLKE